MRDRDVIGQDENDGVHRAASRMRHGRRSPAALRGDPRVLHWEGRPRRNEANDLGAEFDPGIVNERTVRQDPNAAHARNSLGLVGAVDRDAAQPLRNHDVGHLPHERIHSLELHPGFKDCFAELVRQAPKELVQKTA